MENYAAVKRCAGGQQPPLRLRKVQMGYKRCAEVARYGIIRYQTKPADAVHDHRANELRDTDIPQGDPLLLFGQFTLCRACAEQPVCVAVRNPALRRGKEMGAHCAPLR